jgi:hypothetical protein
VTRARVRPPGAGGALAAAAAALAFAAPRSAQADRHELTLAVRPARGSARISEAGTDERVEVRSRGFAAGASLGVRDWLDLGGELVLGYFDKASYAWATLPISANPLSGPVERRSNTAQLRGVATLRLGVGWVPFVQLALGLGARYRTTALLYGPTSQGDRWLIPDGQREEVTLDVVTGIRAGLERRITVHWTAGVSAAAAHSFGVFRPDLQTTDVAISLSYSWYLLLAP